MALVALVALVPACAGIERRSVTPATTVPDPSASKRDVSVDDAFYYTDRDLPAAAPGTIIRAQEVPAPSGTDARAWRVLYHSRSVHDADIVVSGLIIVPDRVAEGRPVVSAGHQIVGLADVCAPSKSPLTVGDYNPGLRAFVQAGYIVGASDFEGLGTRGGHPMFVGVSVAHSLLDMALAVQNFEQSRGSRSTVIVGDGQGAQGALLAAELAATYAPNVNLLGVVASSPVTDPAVLIDLAGDFEGFVGFAVQGMLGFRAAFPEYDPSETMTPSAYRKAIKLKDEVCWDSFLEAFPNPPSEILVRRVTDDPQAEKIMRTQTAGIGKPIAPILIPEIQNLRSEPPNMVLSYVNKLCFQDVAIEYVEINPPGDGDSAAVIEPVSVPWVAARFAGAPAATSCP